MKIIIKLSPEIIIKSQSVRSRFIKILTSNIRNILKTFNKVLSISQHWDNIEISIWEETQYKIVRDMLVCIPGIHHILEIEDVPFLSLHDAFEKVLIRYQEKIKEKTYCVRVKRRGNHKFTSIEVESYIGGKLKQHVKSSRVKLIHPDITINLEIENNRLWLIKGRYEGIGGFPINTQGDVLSLISGGFDSSVSSYMLIRRGCRVHYCFFNLGGIEHEISVRKIAWHLWKRFGSSHRVHFITIDFKFIINEIFEKINDSQMGIVLKRMMIRAASKIADRYGMQALVTGEVLGQVSSQTLTNLHLINKVSELLILRPLVSYDKESVINMSRELGTEYYSRAILEYCGIVSKKPTVRAIQNIIESEEANFDFSILDKVVERANVFDIRKISNNIEQGTFEIEIVNNVNINDIILDIRPIDEQDSNPLKIEGVEVISLPFYKLSAKINELDQSKSWLLWCKNGIMSRLQAIYLREQGFTNVKVYRP